MALSKIYIYLVLNAQSKNTLHFKKVLGENIFTQFISSNILCYKNVAACKTFFFLYYKILQ